MNTDLEDLLPTVENGQDFPKKAWSHHESGILDPRPKFLGFHMPCQDTFLYTPNKEAW
jgi:hypothetical protein